MLIFGRRCSTPLKVHGPIFQNLVSCFIWWISTLTIYIKNFTWNGQAVLMYEAILYIAVAYILLCKLNYGYHNQARFH